MERRVAGSALIVGTFVAGALASGAQAADLRPVLKAPPPVPGFSWAGAYLGLHFGYAWTDVDSNNFFENHDRLGTSSRNEEGGIWGVYGGYNFMFGPNFLAGIEGDSTTTSLWIWLAGTGVLTVPAIGEFLRIGL